MPARHSPLGHSPLSFDLHGFHAGFAFLLCAGPADPYHVAAHGAEGFVIEDEFDNLPASQAESPVQPEPAIRGIHDQAGNPFLVPVQIDDQAGALLRRDPLESAAFGNAGRGWASFALLR